MKIDLDEVKSRTVIAERSYHEGEIIEESPAVILPMTGYDGAPVKPIWPYIFDLAEFRHCYGGEHVGAIVFGRLSLCNHADQANAYVEWEVRRDGTWAVLIARERLPKGAEITLRYANIESYSDRNIFV